MPERANRVLPYLLVVLAAWAGAYVFSDQAIKEVEQRVNNGIHQAREDRYAADIEGCERGNATVRAPLYTLGLVLRNEDDMPEDVHRAADAILTLAEPLQCYEVINKP